MFGKVCAKDRLKVFKVIQNIRRLDDVSLIKANIKAISRDTHHLQCIKLYHFKLDIFFIDLSI